jgi:hypothetical protein
MWRKYLLAIWRNSQKSCAVQKGTPVSAATIDAARGAVQAPESVITQYPESLPTTPARLYFAWVLYSACVAAVARYSNPGICSAGLLGGI